MTQTLIEKLEEWLNGTRKAFMISPAAESDLRAIIEQAKSEAVEPVAYTDSDNNYLEWTIEALCEKAVCSKDDAIQLYTSPQPDHTKLIGELVAALEGVLDTVQLPESTSTPTAARIHALLTKAREAIK